MLFLSLLIALALAISLYFYFVMETTTRVSLKTDDIISASMPDGTQAIVLLNSYNPQFASHPLLASIPLLNMVNSFMPNKLPIDIVCFLQYSNEELNTLYAIGNDVNCRRVFKRLISSDLLIDSPKSIDVEGTRYYIYALRTGEMISAYIGDDYLLFSSNLLLLQIAVKRLYSNSNYFRTLDKKYFDQTKTDGLRCFIRPNIIPFGRDGRASLEEWSSAEWLMMNVDIYPDSLSIQFDIDNSENYRAKDVKLVVPHFNNSSDSTEILINHLSLDAILGFNLTSGEESLEKSPNAIYELYWSQSCLNLLKKYCREGAVIKTIADDITIGENILILPFDNNSDFKTLFQNLLKENFKENQAILRKETIEGYWKAEALPMPIFMRSLLNAGSDERIVYSILNDDELLFATNYTLLINYYKKNRETEAADSIPSGLYSYLKGSFTAIKNNRYTEYLTLPTLFFTSTVQEHYEFVSSKVAYLPNKIRFTYSLSNQ